MKKATAAFVALLLAVAGAVAIAAPAQAAVNGTLTGWTGGYNVQVKVNGSTKSELATLMNLRTDGGQDLSVYCIQINVSTGSGVKYSEGDFESSVQNPAKVLWVLEHGYPSTSLSALGAAAGVPDLSENDAIAGTQVAIWHFSDGAAWADNGHADAKQVYDYLTGPANTGSDPAVPASLAINPGSISGYAGDRVGPFTITMSGTADATVSATNGAKVTDGSGNVITKAGNGDKVYLTLASAGSSSLTATATSTIETGRVFLSKGKQSLILADSTSADTSATATATWEKITTIEKIAAPTFVDGSCDVANDYATPQVQGIEWQVSGEVGWGKTITVKAVAKPGYAIATYARTTWKHTYPAEPDCRTVVTPVAPQVAWEQCAAPGEPGGIIITPATTKGITYRVEGRTVTATAKDGYKLAPAAGWNLDEDGTATYEVTAQNPDDCIVTIEPVEPAVAQSEICDVQGSYTIPPTAGVAYLLDGEAIQAGTYAGPVSGTLTAVAQAGYRLTDPQWSFDLQVAAADVCAVPVAPEVSWEQCAAPGEPGGIVITPATTTGVTYRVEGRTVIASAADGFALVGAEGWSLNEDGTATYEVTAQNPDDCIVTVEPVEPTVVQSEICDVQGSVTFPETAGLQYLLDGEPVSGTLTGPVAGTVTAAAGDGYALTDSEWSYQLDVAAAETCPPTDGGTTPPSDGGTTPPSDGGTTPPTDGGVVPPPGGNGGNLPHTGSEAGVLLLGGLLALAGGAALVLLSRTRRPHGRHHL